MPNVYDFLGDDKEYFMKSSWKVYADLSGVLQYVGKTGNEKVIRTSPEYIEWWDNTSGVQTLYVKDLDKFGFAVDFNWMQVADSNALGITMNTDWDQSDPVWNYHFLGSNQNTLREALWVLVGQTRSGLAIETWIRKGQVSMSGDWSSGAPGDYTNLPATVDALQDTSISNDLRDLVYIRVEKKTSGS